MKKIIVFCMCVLTSCAVQSDLVSLSKIAISANKQCYPKAREILFMMQQNGREAFFKKYPNNLPQNELRDTIFFIDGFLSESSLEYGSVWTKTKKLDYTYREGEVTMRDKPFLSTEQINLISRWDTISLKENALKYANGVHSPLIIFVNRFHKRGNKWIADNVSFKYYSNM